MIEPTRDSNSQTTVSR